MSRRERPNQLVDLVVNVSVLLFLSWLAMLLVGVIHHQWWHAVPTMPYRVAGQIVGVAWVCFGVAASLVKYNRESAAIRRRMP